ncbi:MAG: hypothetical protein JXR37_09815 [Kiritimatiellae bacterium]|nr:hypothetical protein [Kiritimatiellia bacterium]
MARRNRKKSTGGYIFPVPFAALLVLASILALCYLWLDGRCEALAKELKALEAEKETLRQRCATEEGRWAKMKTPPSIEEALLRHNMKMFRPDEKHTVRVYEVN